MGGMTILGELSLLPSNLYALNPKSLEANRACERIVHQRGSLQTAGKSIKGKKLKDQSARSAARARTRTRDAISRKTRMAIQTQHACRDLRCDAHTWIRKRGKRKTKVPHAEWAETKTREFPCFTLTDSWNKIEQEDAACDVEIHSASD